MFLHGAYHITLPDHKMNNVCLFFCLVPFILLLDPEHTDQCIQSETIIPAKYVEMYIVFGFPFVCSYLCLFVCSSFCHVL